jgi:hypothetical protein
LCCPPFFKDSDYPYGIFKLFLSFCLLSFDRFISVFHQFTALDYPFSIFKLFLSPWKCASYILLSYGTAGSMIPQYLFCLFLLHCSATRRFFYLYIHKHNRHIYRNVWGHSVQMSWIFVSTRIFIFSLEIADIFILHWYHAF